MIKNKQIREVNGLNESLRNLNNQIVEREVPREGK